MSSKYSGYMGRVILINLTDRTVKPYPWSDEERRLFMGGKIMAAKILSDTLTGREEPFSEENLLIVSTGPLTETGVPSSGRFNISTISPLTGITTSSNCGGNFGYYMKKAGYDAIIFRGRAGEHTRIHIHNDQITFHNADELWGKVTSETQEDIARILSEGKTPNAGTPPHGTICIGPAGENLVRYASVTSNERVAGRAGTGAVMGWMNLKAVSVSGNHKISIFNPKKLKKINKAWFKLLRSHPLTGKQLPKMGTAALVSQMQAGNLLATRNFRDGRHDDFEKVSGETLAAEYNVVNKGCLSCPIRCARTVNIDGVDVKGPELETLGLMGGGLGNSSLEHILKWNLQLDELGMDTISAAGTLAWAMEAGEKGIMDNGLKFGEPDKVSQIWEDIAYRRGIGDELANGSRWLSEKYGGKDFAIHSKGLELAAYEPRRAVGMGLGYAVSNRGGCHLNGGYMVLLEGLGLKIDSQTGKGKPDITVMFQNTMEAVSASGQCLFTSYTFIPGVLLNNPNAWYTKAVNIAFPYLGFAVRAMNKFPNVAAMHLPVIFPHTKAFKAATGMPMTFGKYMAIGNRGYTMERALNCRFGITASDDTLPKRLTDDLQDPSDPKTRVPLEKMKKVYYRARGWDKNGIPTAKTLKRLKLKRE